MGYMSQNQQNMYDLQMQEAYGGKPPTHATPTGPQRGPPVSTGPSSGIPAEPPKRKLPKKPIWKQMSSNDLGDLEIDAKTMRRQYMNQTSDADKAYKAEGLRAAGTDSPWAKLALQTQDLEQQTAANQAATQAASGRAGAWSGLAMRGGLSSGARQRIAMQGSRDLSAARQNVGLAGQSQRLGIRSTDEGNRLQSQKDYAAYNATRAATGADIQYRGDAANLQAGAGVNTSQNQFNKDIYGIKRQDIAAQEYANAIRKS